MAMLLDGTANEGTNQLRCRKIMKKMTTSSAVEQVQSLPTTKMATRLYSFRVYHQVQTWIGKRMDASTPHPLKFHNKIVQLLVFNRSGSVHYATKGYFIRVF